MKEIPLTQGKVALVDDCDFEELNKYKWSAISSCKTWYATRYERTPSGKQTIRMHRQLLGLPKSRPIVDHHNHNGLDNRRENLRICTHAENQQNQLPNKANGKTSQFKGVDWRAYRNKWLSRIHKDGMCIHLGYFTSEIEAAKAYDAAALKYFGGFACLNFPDPAVY